MPCPLCSAEGAVIEVEEPNLLVSCPRCSDFSITRAAAAQWKHGRVVTAPDALLRAWKHLGRVRESGQLPLLTLAQIDTWMIQTAVQRPNLRSAEYPAD